MSADLPSAKSERSLVRQAHLDVRCKICKNVGGAYCDDCAVAVYAVQELWAERNRLHGALEEIADTSPPPTAARSVWMQSKAREALGRNEWTND